MAIKVREYCPEFAHLQHAATSTKHDETKRFHGSHISIMKYCHISLFQPIFGVRFLPGLTAGRLGRYRRARRAPGSTPVLQLSQAESAGAGDSIFTMADFTLKISIWKNSLSIKNERRKFLILLIDSPSATYIGYRTNHLIAILPIQRGD